MRQPKRNTATEAVCSRCKGSMKPLGGARAAGHDGNEFLTIAEAEETILELRALGEEWADATYRVVERRG